MSTLRHCASRGVTVAVLLTLLAAGGSSAQRVTATPGVTTNAPTAAVVTAQLETLVAAIGATVAGLQSLLDQLASLAASEPPHPGSGASHEQVAAWADAHQGWEKEVNAVIGAIDSVNAKLADLEQQLHSLQQAIPLAIAKDKASAPKLAQYQAYVDTLRLQVAAAVVEVGKASTATRSKPLTAVALRSRFGALKPAVQRTTTTARRWRP